MANRRRYFQENGGKERGPVGTLSDELREAIHLEDDMLPFWIYRMRVLGYPPAWMKEAEMSTLTMFDTAAGASSAAAEDGEIKDQPSATYNKESLIEFPGFNAPVPENVKDDWLILGMPPLIMNQQLTEAVKSMNLIQPVPYKRSKLDTSTASKDESQIESPSSPDHESSLNTSDQDVIFIGEGDSSESKKPENGAQNGRSSVANRDLEASMNGVGDSLNESTRSESKLKMISMGVPVPDSVKPKLPPLENWAVGMGELMHFENLPTSTGAYKGKMKGILTKVRNRFNQTEEENDENKKE